MQINKFELSLDDLQRLQAHIKLSRYVDFLRTYLEGYCVETVKGVITVYEHTDEPQQILSKGGY